MKRVCFVGGSLVEGMGDETGQGWVARLGQEASGTICYNLGIRGQTLSQIRQRAIRECKARIPTYGAGGIVLCTGLNDLARLEDGRPRVPARRILQTLRGLVFELGQVAPIIVVGPFPVYEPSMPFFSKASGVNFHFRNDEVAHADQSYETLCSSMETPYLSVFQALYEHSAYMEG